MFCTVIDGISQIIQKQKTRRFYLSVFHFRHKAVNVKMLCGERCVMASFIIFQHTRLDERLLKDPQRIFQRLNCWQSTTYTQNERLKDVFTQKCMISFRNLRNIT